jgi:hypothetical protein
MCDSRALSSLFPFFKHSFLFLFSAWGRSRKGSSLCAAKETDTFLLHMHSTLTANIRRRRGSKVALNMPIYFDTNTPKPFIDPTVPRDRNQWPEDASASPFPFPLSPLFCRTHFLLLSQMLAKALL